MACFTLLQNHQNKETHTAPAKSALKIVVFLLLLYGKVTFLVKIYLALE